MTSPDTPSPPAGTHGGCTHTSDMDGDGTIHLYCTPTAPEPEREWVCDLRKVLVHPCTAEQPHDLAETFLCCGYRPTAPEPAAAPQVDTAAVREIAALFDPPHPADAGLLYAAADELDTHHARHAELVALVADLRENGEKFRQYGYLGIAEHLARILGEQP